MGVGDTGGLEILPQSVDGDHSASLDERGRCQMVDGWGVAWRPQLVGREGARHGRPWAWPLSETRLRSGQRLVVRAHR